MSGIMFYLILTSLVGLLVISIRHLRESHNGRLLSAHLVILCLFSFLIWLFFQRAGVLTARGVSRNDEGAFILGLYAFMLIGMVAQWSYTRFVQPRLHVRHFDFGLFIAPLMASSLVCIPLLASLQNETTNLEGMAGTKMMVFFVAFVNGFLWKEYFDGRKMGKISVPN